MRLINECEVISVVRLRLTMILALATVTYEDFLTCVKCFLVFMSVLSFIISHVSSSIYCLLYLFFLFII